MMSWRLETWPINLMVEAWLHSLVDAEIELVPSIPYCIHIYIVTTLQYIFHQRPMVTISKVSKWSRFCLQVVVYFTHPSPLGVSSQLSVSSHHFPQSPVTNRWDCDEMSDVTPRDAWQCSGVSRVTCHAADGRGTELASSSQPSAAAAIIRDIRRHVYEMMEWNTKINLLSPQIRLLLCVMCGLPSVPSAPLLPSLCDDTKCDSYRAGNEPSRSL